MWSNNCVPMYVHEKEIPVETTPGTGEGVNSSMMHLIHCKTFLYATMYPHPAQQ
jgi:hypothetical protein